MSVRYRFVKSAKSHHCRPESHETAFDRKSFSSAATPNIKVASALSGLFDAAEYLKAVFCCSSQTIEPTAACPLPP